MAKFIEFDGWEFNDGDKVDVHFIINVDHIIRISQYKSKSYYSGGIEYILSNRNAFYVSEGTHKAILEQLFDNA